LPDSAFAEANLFAACPLDATRIACEALHDLHVIGHLLNNPFERKWLDIVKNE